jgi:hypothetical protein
VEVEVVEDGGRMGERRTEEVEWWIRRKRGIDC